MGFLRFFLAVLVVLGHLGVGFLGLHFAVSAVVVFYMLAGHVVCKLWNGTQEQQMRSRLLWFYKDRMLRILPLYFTVLLFSITVWLAGAKSIFLSAQPSLEAWLSNILVIPLNYYMYTGMDSFTLIPPAWSLAAELQFYIIIPLLLTVRKIGIIFGVATFSCYILAQLNILQPDYFGYRLLAGVGFIFLLGGLIEDRGKIPRMTVLCAWVASTVYAAFLALYDRMLAFNLDVALGLSIGIPIIFLFLKFPRSGAFHKLQKKAGEISYGMFLFHFPVLWMFQLLGYEGHMINLFVVVVSALFAWIAHVLVERPIWSAFRPTLRPTP
jgi:peptidoglycan/LPS O-acetylase OafA/YrhL